VVAAGQVTLRGAAASTFHVSVSFVITEDDRAAGLA
jgi:hypothetical protein